MASAAYTKSPGSPAQPCLRPTRVLGSPELGRYSDGVLNCAAPEKCDAVHRNIFPAAL